MELGFLAIIDVDRIHDYVFRPHQLKLIRGASQILRRLTEEELVAPLGMSDHEPSELISSAGGTVLATFAGRTEADNYCKGAQELFRQRTAIASVSWAVAERQPTFRATLDLAQAELEKRKSGKAVRQHDSGSPYFTICQDCGLHSAASTYNDFGKTERTCCPGCEQRRKSGDRRMYLEAVEQAACATLKENPSFEQLGGKSVPKHYLAFVYIDLDRLGRYLYDHGGESPRAYKHLSHLMKNAVEGAVTGACAALELPTDHSAPFEILLMGGDDVVLVLRAQYVFRFFREFDQRFAAATENLKPISYSASVVWAHQQFPIARFREHADALVQLAKYKSGNSIEYDVITEALIEAPSDSPARQTQDAPGGGFSLRRTLKPYSVADFLKLECTIRKWRKENVPANRVKKLYRIAFESFEQSLLDYWFLLSRLNKGHREVVGEYFKSPYGLWSDGDYRTTRAVDLVELWDFVERG